MARDIPDIDVEILGRWESGPGIETPHQVMMSLLNHGVLEDWYVHDAVLLQSEDEMMLYDPNNEKQLYSFPLSIIDNAAAFVSKKSSNQTFSDVVIFSLLGEGHFSNNTFIALQCINYDPRMLAEQLEEAAGQERSRMRRMSMNSAQPRPVTPEYDNRPPVHDYSQRSSPRSGQPVPINGYAVPNNNNNGYPSPGNRYPPQGNGYSVPNGNNYPPVNNNYAGVHRRTPSSTSGGTFTPFQRRDSIRSDNTFTQPQAVPPPRAPEHFNRENTLGLLAKPGVHYDHTTDQVEKDTILINYCTEDIERFCRDLRDAYDGTPGARSIGSFKASDFNSIFQKIKLSFILLGRMNGKIFEPNAADLVHHLMRPLAYLMDCCKDLYDENLQEGVVSPLLTSQAITLLSHCLNSKETLIWEGCGDSWMITKKDYHGQSVPYRPVFHDGWSPGYLDFSEESANGQIRREHSLTQHDVMARQADPMVTSAPVRRTNSNRNRDYPKEKALISVLKATKALSDSDENDGEPAEDIASKMESFRDTLMARQANIVLVTFPYYAKESKELTVQKGEYLEVLNNDRKWWKVRNYQNKIGHVPYTLLTTIHYQEAVFEPAKPAPKPERTIQNAPHIPQPTYHEPEVPYRKRSSERSSSPTPSIPPPPPPQPKFTPSQQNTIVIKKKPYRSSSIDTNFSMQDELRNVLSAYSEEKAKQLSIHKTPDVYIDMRSTAREVQHWLKEKQFSQRVLTQIEGMNGKQVLSMHRRDLEIAFGKEEGARLDSQITLSRNHTKYTQGKNSELRAVLAKAKERAEKSKAIAVANEIEDELEAENIISKA